MILDTIPPYRVTSCAIGSDPDLILPLHPFRSIPPAPQITFLGGRKAMPGASCWEQIQNRPKDREKLGPLIGRDVIGRRQIDTAKEFGFSLIRPEHIG